MHYHPPSKNIGGMYALGGKVRKFNFVECDAESADII